MDSSPSSSSRQVFVENLFTGEEWIHNVTLTLAQHTDTDDNNNDNGHAGCLKKSIVSHSSPIELGDAIDRVCYMMPPLADLQIYGAHEQLLSEFPTVDCILRIQNYCHDGGAWFYQPTVATNDLRVLRSAIDAVRAFLRSAHNTDGRCLGIHLEGPWISAAKRGAHILEHIHSPSYESVKELLDYGEGVISMITLAPEVVADEILDLIDGRGIVISAGHSDITYESAMKHFSQINPNTQRRRIRTATHLYNAMSAFQHRAPGLVGAVWRHPTVFSSIVCDGYHVDFAAVALAKQLMGSRLFCITDAVTTTSTGAYQHYRVGDKYESQGILSGSALTMLKAMDNLVDKVGVELGEAIRMCSLYPAEVVNRPQTCSGRIFTSAQKELCLEECEPVLCLDRNRQFIRFM